MNEWGRGHFTCCLIQDRVKRKMKQMLIFVYIQISCYLQGLFEQLHLYLQNSVQTESFLTYAH